MLEDLLLGAANEGRSAWDARRSAEGDGQAERGGMNLRHVRHVEYGSQSSGGPVDRLSRLPGIRKKTAQRLAFHLLRIPAGRRRWPWPSRCARLREETEDLRRLRQHRATPRAAAFCDDPRRDHSLLCVVEQPADVVAVERTGAYRGLYHVLADAQAIGCDPVERREASARMWYSPWKAPVRSTATTSAGCSTTQRRPRPAADQRRDGRAASRRCCRRSSQVPTSSRTRWMARERSRASSLGTFRM